MYIAHSVQNLNVIKTGSHKCLAGHKCVVVLI